MVKIPVRFKRVAAAFNEAVRLCESSGSEHSAASEGPDDNLSDLVASFMERELRVDNQELFDIDEEIYKEHEDEDVTVDSHDLLSGSETVDMLKELLFGSNYYGDEEEKEMIRREVDEIVRESIKGERDLSSEGFKRRIMTCLRERGFNAGLCKSRWEKSGHRPSGSYYYIDTITANDHRYIIEINLASQFEIARSTTTTRFATLLNLFPTVFVGPTEELKKIVRLMCRTMKQSMKSTDMAMPPWRRNSYMQCKWLASYKRTTNKEPTNSATGVGDQLGSVTRIRSVGFVASPVVVGGCRDEFSRDGPVRIGQLTATFRSN